MLFHDNNIIASIGWVWCGMLRSALLIEFIANCMSMVYSHYKKLRILYLSSQGYKPPTIARMLEEEGMKASRRGIGKFLKVFKETGTIARQQGSGRPSKITGEVKNIVEEQMRANDETTAHQLHALLVSKGYGLSLRTVLRCRVALGWTFRGSAYCQLIREENKQERLEWARKNLHEAANGFQDVIFTDEASIQLETHRRFCCHKIGERPKNKPRYIMYMYMVYAYVHVCLYGNYWASEASPTWAIHLGFFIYYILSYVRRGLCDPLFFFLRCALCAVQRSCTVCSFAALAPHMPCMLLVIMYYYAGLSIPPRSMCGQA